MTSSFFKSGVLCSLLALAGCGSSPLEVQTDPVGAEVWIANPGQVPRKAGVAPMTLNPGDLGDAGQPVQVMVTKEGHHPLAVLIPASMTGRTGRISLKMEQAVLPTQCLNQTESMNKMARGIAEAQSLIKSKQLEPAEKILTTMTVDYPGLSVVFDLLGNIHYLKRNFEQAAIAYRRSLQLAPDNANTERILKQIDSLTGRTTSPGTNR